MWDVDRQLLFCARDAVGARPFYYSKSPDPLFVLASDIDAVLAVPGVMDDLDEAFVTAYLMGEPPDSGRTFFLSIRSLPPGHCLAIGAGSERVWRWWRPENSPSVHGGLDEDIQREFLDRYRQSVRARLEGAGEIRQASHH